MKRWSWLFLILCLALTLVSCDRSIPGDLQSLIPYDKQSDAAYHERLYQKFLEDNDNQDVLYELISAYKDRGDDRSCVKAFELYLKAVPEDVEVLIDLAYCQMNLGDYEEARSNCEKAISLDYQNHLAYNALGNVFADLSQYENAIANYTRAYELSADFESARTNLLWAYYNSGRYEKCIDFALIQTQNGHRTYEVYHYLGLCYAALNQLNEASDSFLEALNYDYEDYSDAYYQLGLLAMQQENYDEALDYVQKSLEQYPSHQDALWLTDELENLQLRWPERFADFIEDNYLYKDYLPDFDQKINELRSIAALPQDGAINDVKAVLHPDDPFSGILTGEDYDLYYDQQETPTVFHTVKSLEKMPYELFRIEAFNNMTGKHFLQMAEAIENKEEKVLVFDLRGNGGGDMKACTEILDYLLGDCATVNFITREGYSSSYYSSADHVLFKKIILLTDQYTASASELLTLGLKVYHPDTLIIGEKTYGKGVSQIFCNDTKNKIALCLVNTYWNVREINIQGYGIEPDQAAKTQNEYDLALQKALNMLQ